MRTDLGFISTYNPQTDGQTKVTNKSLGNNLTSFVSDHPKQWDQALPQVEFAYNDSPKKSTGLNPFQIVYARPPEGIMLAFGCCESVFT